MSVRSSLYYRRGAGGKVAIEDMANSTGQRFFVCSVTGTDGTAYGFTPDKPFATISYAITKATASKDDVVYVMENHVETLAATITPLAGMRIIGLGRGASRPKITGLTGIAMLTLSAANVTVQNIHFLAVTGSTYIVRGTAASPILEDCTFEQVAVPVKACHFAGINAGLGAEFRRCTFLGKLDGPDYCVHFSSSAGDYWTMDDCTANYMVAGLDNGVVYSDHKQLGYVIKNCTFLGLDDSVAVITSSVGAMIDGVMINTTMHVTAISASVEDLLDDAKGLGLLGCLATDDKSKWAVPISTAQASAS